ncbi:hypothetical protein XU18_5085, partial [Perkinsela sp. CCAP 1560/4]
NFIRTVAGHDECKTTTHREPSNVHDHFCIFLAPPRSDDESAFLRQRQRYTQRDGQAQRTFTPHELSDTLSGTPEKIHSHHMAVKSHWCRMSRTLE